MLKRKQAIETLNSLGEQHIPFSFYCDYMGETWNIQAGSVNPKKPFYLSIGTENHISDQPTNIKLTKHPITFNAFELAFEQVIQEINQGNSFLTNLTFETPIEVDRTLEQLYNNTSAKYRLYVPGEFVVFSPETFVRIEDGLIKSYPMKGTIDADIEKANEKILLDPKETAEHVTIVDLIRNDLSQVANEVEVTKFRFIDKINTSEKALLQVSSEVVGKLSTDWRLMIGTILSSLLPAGSISGAPKPSTIQIINRAENYDRGFYTGICGHFDGEKLDSGVMIRFIKSVKDQHYYCSGGGITSFSDVHKEYQEMIDKIYIPI